MSRDALVGSTTRALHLPSSVLLLSVPEYSDNFDEMAHLFSVWCSLLINDKNKQGFTENQSSSKMHRVHENIRTITKLLKKKCKN